MVSIVPTEAGDKNPCIVCGKMTLHRHSYSNAPMGTVPVCLECCKNGCGGVHKVIEIPAFEFFCNHCKKSFPIGSCGKVMDKYFCPDCQDVVVPKGS